MTARKVKQPTQTLQPRAAEDRPLARAVANAKRRRKREAVTEAMKQSQRATAAGERPQERSQSRSAVLVFKRLGQHCGLPLAGHTRAQLIVNGPALAAHASVSAHARVRTTGRGPQARTCSLANGTGASGSGQG